MLAEEKVRGNLIPIRDNNRELLVARNSSSLGAIADFVMNGKEDEVEIRQAIDGGRGRVSVDSANLTQDKIIELQNYAKEKGVSLTLSWGK